MLTSLAYSFKNDTSGIIILQEAWFLFETDRMYPYCLFCPVLNGEHWHTQLIWIPSFWPGTKNSNILLETFKSS